MAARSRGEADPVKLGMPAAARADARVILLGSLPGERSLAERRYYAHPSNQFWRLVGGAIGADLGVLDYDQRLARLAGSRIGLWDVIGTARRRGSLDQAIRDAAANPLPLWLARFPELRAVAFNGAAAARTGRALIGAMDGIALLDLPSSSAANTLPLAAKAERWAELARFL